MDQPPSFLDPCRLSILCKLKKALYGLKHAPSARYLELSFFLIKFGYQKSVSDASLLVYSLQGVLAYFLVYVDDIVLTGIIRCF